MFSIMSKVNKKQKHKIKKLKKQRIIEKLTPWLFYKYKINWNLAS